MTVSAVVLYMIHNVFLVCSAPSKNTYFRHSNSRALTLYHKTWRPFDYLAWSVECAATTVCLQYGNQIVRVLGSTVSPKWTRRGKQDESAVTHWMIVFSTCSIVPRQAGQYALNWCYTNILYNKRDYFSSFPLFLPFHLHLPSSSRKPEYYYLTMVSQQWLWGDEGCHIPGFVVWERSESSGEHIAPIFRSEE
jgi:hypothetical protein